MELLEDCLKDLDQRKKRCIFISKTDMHLTLNVLFNFRRVHCLVLSNAGHFMISFMLEVKTRDTDSGVRPVQVAPLCAGPSPGLSGQQRLPPVQVQVRHLCSVSSSCWRLLHQYLAHISLLNKALCLWVSALTLMETT